MGPDLLLDSRLALVHRADGWLAVADLHLGYALERRRRGGLFPDYGDDEVARRLLALLDEHRPRTLILAGDIIDGSAAPEPGVDLLRRLAARPGLGLVALRGNHDRSLQRALAGAGGAVSAIDLAAAHRQGRFVFHHGDAAGRLAAEPLLAAAGPGAVEVCGHLHPAVVLRDGAGTRLKLPALWRRVTHPGGCGERLVLPAFSPWSAGGPPEPARPRRRGAGRGGVGKGGVTTSGHALNDAGHVAHQGGKANGSDQTTPEDEAGAPDGVGELWVCAPGRVFRFDPPV